jgi:hypothetical protein
MALLMSAWLFTLLNVHLLKANLRRFIWDNWMLFWMIIIPCMFVLAQSTERQKQPKDNWNVGSGVAPHHSTIFGSQHLSTIQPRFKLWRKMLSFSWKELLCYLATYGKENQNCFCKPCSTIPNGYTHGYTKYIPSTLEKQNHQRRKYNLAKLGIYYILSLTKRIICK